MPIHDIPRTAALTLLLVLGLISLVANGCVPDKPPSMDDDTSTDDDDMGDDDDVGDDDTEPTDICDDFPGDIVCDGNTAVTCDAAGDIHSTEDCDVDAGFTCWQYIGCVMCYPSTRWCDGNDVLECSADGQAATVVQTCNEAAGEVCQAGECVSLCDIAEDQASSIGCKFYGVDMEQNHDAPTEPYAIVVSNVHESIIARVVVETKSAGVWNLFTQVDVAPQDLSVVEFPGAEIVGTGLGVGYSYRVTSNIPVIAYQFNPLDGSGSYTTDASLMLPASAFDIIYRIPAWGSQYGNSSINVVAEVDGTEVVVTPTVNTAAGTGVPSGQAGVPMAPITLDEGDVLQVSAPTNTSLDGSLVEATQRVGVFSGNQCANIPTSCYACDHIEEQIFGLQRWGTEYVASQLPARTNPPEYAIWHVMAGDVATTVTFQADVSVTGVPPQPVTLAAGESIELTIQGAGTVLGDFYVSGTEAFLVTQYMIGSSCAGNTGDPCMVQAVPIEQFLDSYVVLVPASWVTDKMTLIREPGTTITVDGTNVDTWPAWSETGNVAGMFEIVRLQVEDGAHVLEGTSPFGVQVVGYDDWDSYCYPGGLNQEIINDL